MNRILISHSNEDSELANQLQAIIKRASLNQINVWHSSDRAGTGGLRPGDRWLSRIRERLADSNAVVALLTPNSLKRPWIYFESGFGAANADLEVIPVAVGIDVEDIPFPLAMYQAFRLSGRRSALDFIAKLFSRFGSSPESVGE